LIRGKEHLVVLGCSFSTSQDQNLVESGYTFGDIIANKYNMKFHELGISAGTNQYVEKRFFNWFGENKDKMDSTFVVVAWSEPNRLLFWNNKKLEWLVSAFQINLDNGGEHFKDDKIIHEWTYEERKRYVQNFCLNTYAVTNTYIEQIISLQSFLKLNNIPYIMFNSLWGIKQESALYFNRDETIQPEGLEPNRNRKMWENLVDETYFYDKIFRDLTEPRENIPPNKDLWMSESDSHPNKKGHKIWSDMLIKFIEEVHV